jgi:hypothetical protein
MALIPIRWKIRGAIVLAFVLGVLGFAQWRVSVAETKRELQTTKRRLETIRKAGGIDDEVEKLSSDDLLRESRRWVRPSE